MSTSRAKFEIIPDIPKALNMNPDQQALVRESFKKVVPISVTAASLFYGRLFELNPKLRPLFKGDLAEQGRKLMAMLGMVVADVHRLRSLLPPLRDLVRRHVPYSLKIQ